MNQKEKVRETITIKNFDAELHYKAKVRAAIEKTTFKAIVEKALWEYLEKQGVKKRKMRNCRK